MEIALAIIDIALCVGIIVLVLFQSSNEGGLSGTITGNTETFLGKNKGKRKDRVLTKFTMILGIALVVMTLILIAIFIVK